MRRAGPDFWFYKAQSLCAKVDPMCFSAKSKKCVSSLLLASVALWFSGCSESASTPPVTTSSSRPSKVNSDGSVKGAGAARSETPSSSSDSDDAGEATKEGIEDDEQAGSSTGSNGREVPDADPAGDDGAAKSADEPKDE